MLPVGNLAQERRRFPAAERRETITRAAGPLFAKHGYDATRLDEVAAAAGVTKPIVYRHFASKKDLYLALLRKHRDDLPTFTEEIEVPTDPEARRTTLRTLLSFWLEYVRENRHSWTMIFRDSSGDEEIRAFRREVNARAFAVMEDIIGAWSGGSLPAAQVPPAAHLLTSGLAGMALWWGDHPEAPKEVLVDAAMRVIAPALDA